MSRGERRETRGARSEGRGTARLQKILSAAGVASRRLSEELIASGRVSVNGTVVTELGTKADPDADDIRVDGRRVKVEQRRRYILLYKPRGYVTTRSDPEGRRTVLDLLKGVPEYIYPVGRLDYDSEGLLLLTNDGDLAARLTHPRHEVERLYEAKVRGVPDARALERLAKGVTIDGRRTAPAVLEMRSRPSLSARGPAPHPGSVARGGPKAPLRSLADAPHSIVHISIHEGRNRQVRQMFETVGHPVMRLKRVRIGPIEDPHLPPGHWRELSPREIEQLRRVTRPKPKA